MIGRPDISMAIQNALQVKGGDALINVTCYEETAWFFFVSMHKVIVEGEAVTFDKGQTDNDKKNTVKKNNSKIIKVIHDNKGIEK